MTDNFRKMVDRIDIQTLKKRIISTIIVLVVFSAMLYSTGIRIEAANGVRQSGRMFFYIVDRQSGVRSDITINIWSNSGKVDASHFWGQSTHWKASISSSGSHGLWIADGGVRDLWTQPDANGNYRVFHIPIYFTQTPYYYCDTIDVAKRGSNADSLYASGLDTGLVDNYTTRGFTIVVNGSQLGICTRAGVWYDGMDSAMALYYTRPSYLVNFEDGKGGTFGDRYVLRGDSTTYPNTTPVKTGYNFLGWVEPGAILGNTTVKGNWSIKKIKYVYHSNGGTGTMEDTEIAWGTTGNLSKNLFTREGYIFSGWSLSQNGDLKYIDEDSVTNLTDQDQTIDLYAVWDRVNDTYIFNANGGTGTMEPFVVSYDTSANLPANQFKKAGYSFAGWSISETDAAKTYDDQDLVSKAKDSLTNKTVQLYALWKENVCTIIYDKNHGKGTQMPEDTAHYNSPSITLKSCSYTRPGYEFVGWSTDKRGIKEYNNRQNISVTSWIEQSDKTVTLYAIWQNKDANFRMDYVEKDNMMFAGSKKIKGQNGTVYDESKTDSEYARQDTGEQKGYFSAKE